MSTPFRSSLSGPSLCLLADSRDWPWLEFPDTVIQSVRSDEDCKDADAIFLPGTDDLAALQHLQTLGRLYPKKPIVLLLKEADSDQETAAVELGAFDIWTPESRISPAFARLRNQIAMLKETPSGPRKRIHSPFLKRKQRLLQVLLSVVEKPEEFRTFVQDFFSGIETLRADVNQREILERLNQSSGEWGLDFLQRRLNATTTPQNLTQAGQDLRVFLKTHEKLLTPILQGEEPQGASEE